MNTSTTTANAIEQACRRIAPTWPLDQSIAVNPYWGYVQMPIPDASATLSSLTQTSLLPSRRVYLDHWRSGRLQARHIEQAIANTNVNISSSEIVALLSKADPRTVHRRLVTDVVDDTRELTTQAATSGVVTHHISQFCASFFDHGQASWAPAPGDQLYPSWLHHASHDLSPMLLLGINKLTRAFESMPIEPEELIDAAVQALNVDPGEQEAYFLALLLSINGWAAWCAYLRWQANLAQRDDSHLMQLLAIRLAWEWALYECAPNRNVTTAWRVAMNDWSRLAHMEKTSRSHDWILQHALELSFQEALFKGLKAPRDHVAAPQAPAFQAAFCIDVRSEIFRRALEKTSTEVQTIGFAGFFGLPIQYTPFATELCREQLPGLLAPRLRVCEQHVDPSKRQTLIEKRRRRLQLGQTWHTCRSAALSMFSFVETTGIFYAFRLLIDAFALKTSVVDPKNVALFAKESKKLKPRLAEHIDASVIDLEKKVDLAHGILRAMTLTKNFARLILLAGHGSQTANNPHAAALDCGACCGQSGEINARVLAALLNDAQVRAGLKERGMIIDARTHFVGGLHNTTTDDLQLFDLDEVPATHRQDVVFLERLLKEAGHHARAERAKKLQLGHLDERALSKTLSARARDWSQVRPEWGLAGNAAFIVAPRARTRHLNLEGRVFLHDYDFQQDTDHSILELIITAPMIVTHWINMQYYASTVDNQHFGSGNKVLHNVVGANLGVFEGNGGDLRIGLSRQSLHNGKEWMHEPLRLSVFIEAPQSVIGAIVARHALVRHLVDNGWLYLFQVEPQQSTISRLQHNAWTLVHTNESDPRKN